MLVATGERVQRVRLLRAGRDAVWSRSDDGVVAIDVPRLDTIEIVALDLV